MPIVPPSPEPAPWIRLVRRFLVLTIVLVASLLGATSLAQFSTGVSLVEVYATVSDERGEPVRGLTAADFVVTEDGIQQAVSAFANVDVPLAVAVAIDRSFSIPREQLTPMANAAAGFIRELGSGDQVMVLGIGSEIEVLAELSTDRERATAALAGLQRWGTTPLNDAIQQAIDRIHAAAGRRALVVLSDGRDRYSTQSAGAIVDHARRRNVLVYPVAIGRSRPALFVELASVTGGRSLQIADVRQLPKALSAIALELRSQYLLGYSTSRPPGGEVRWRSIGVTTNRPDVRVRARDGYFGP